MKGDSIIYITDTIIQKEIVYLQDSLVVKQLVNLGSIAEKANDNTFLGASYDAVFATLTSVVIFGLGFFIQWIINICKENSKKKLVKKYFEENISALKQSIKRLKESYDKHYKGHTPIKGYYFTPPLDFYSEIELIERINKEELFKAFSDEAKLKLLRKKLNAVEKFKGVISLASKYQDMVYDKGQVQLKEYDKLRIKFFSIVEHTNNNSTLSDVKISISKFESSIQKMYDDEKLLNFETQTKAINLLMQNLFLNRDKEDLSEIISIGSQFLIILRRMSELSNNFKGQYENFSSGLDKIKSSLD